MNYNELSAIQVDALREVINIGAGNGATSLSQLLNMTIDMTVPDINVINFNDIISTSSDEKIVAGILVRVLGSAPGNILLVFEEEAAMNIIKILCNDCYDIDSEMGKSILCEIGNIISASYMNSISCLTSLTLIPSVPAISHDMLEAIMTTAFIETAQYSESVLEVNTVLLGPNKDKIGVDFYYIPMPGSLEQILDSIGIK